MRLSRRRGRPVSFLLLLLGAGLVAGTGRAQERRLAADPAPTEAAARRPAVPPLARLFRGAHLQMQGDTVVGGGPDYRVRFAAGTMEFTPAFGRAAPHNAPLRFTLSDVRRGGAVVPAAHGGSPEPDADRLCVEYDHGSFVECYALLEAGVEQSFVFDRLPAGEGDLVVRGRLECELPYTPDGGGLRFDFPGVGSFRMGGVVGIAADGARAEGALRLVDGVLELSLPDAFVRDAALPLTLDPLVGGVMTLARVGTRVIDVQAPCIAYDISTDRYLVVWQSILSATDSNIVGQLVNGDGSLFGLASFIENSQTGAAFEPAVANINAQDAFVVTFTRGGDVIAQAVSARSLGFLNSLLISTEVVVAGGSVVEHRSSVGGEATLLDDKAVCVWKAEGATRTSPTAIRARQIAVDNRSSSQIGISLASAAVTVLGDKHDHPRISRNAGPGQRYAIATHFLATSANHDPYVTIVNRLGQPIAAPVVLSSSALDETVPDVDGDGTTFVAAWMRQFAANDGDVMARSFSFDPANGSIRFNSVVATVVADRGDDEGWPSVCWTGGSALVGYMDQDTPGTSNWAAYVKSIDFLHCTACEGFFWLGRNNGFNMTPQVACKTPGLASPEDAMIVWESASSTSASPDDILAQFWTTRDGRSTQLAGSCGKGGTCYTACARLRNTSYAYELRAAAASAPTVFLLSGAQTSFPCGPCLLVPSPASGFVLGLSTDGNGAASLPAPIPDAPNLLNVPLYVQWATVNVVDPACTVFRLDLSNALSFVIEG